MENTNKKVLLRIDNLKQWFPIAKGVVNKANDGITIDIYEGETFGLVGESGCGKSTLGRTILQVYKQTDGRTMYYGRSIDELSPNYVRQTIRQADKKKAEMKKLQEKRDALEAEFASLTEEQKIDRTEELRVARKQADDALFELASVMGGFITLDDMSAPKEQLLKIYGLSKELHKLELERRSREVDLADAEYKYKEDPSKGDKKIETAKAKLDAVKEKIDAVNEKLDAEHAVLNGMKEQYADNEEFQKYEAMRDEGIDLARLNYEEMRQLRSEMQLIFQDPYSSLNPRMSVGQIVGEGMFAHGFFKKNSPRSQDEILRVMEECGLAPYFVHRYPYQFSGGQRQRIGIARSLATRPKFVVCDEAVSALDVSIQSQIINLLSDLKDKQNLTYLFITHDLSVVKYISDRIGVMYLGNMVELATSEDTFAHPLHPYTAALLAAIPTTDLDANREPEVLEGDIPSPVNPPKGCKFHTRCKYCTEICTKVAPEWKEVRPNHYVACHHIIEENL